MALHLDPTTGHLPRGVHEASVDEIKVTFVDPFPTSRTRRPIYDLWLEYRKAITSIVPMTGQWLNGSFATAKLHPGDADVVTFLDHDAVEALEKHQQILLLGLFHGTKTKEGCRCDGYLIVEYPPGHSARAETERAMRYFRGLYERVRGDDSASKGFLRVGDDVST